MHYALVSDLLTKEEFDERVEKKCDELGGAVDDICAAMLVVEEMGRSHIKIGEIKNTSTVLVCFFGKILEIIQPHEFTRDDGEGTEPGLVASIVLGDPTGTVKMTLWDAKATAVAELEVGSVIEVIAKPRLGYQCEVTCAALRPTQVTIVETKKPPRSETMKVPFTVKVLYIGKIRKITRHDGSPAELQDIIVGNPSGTTRIITWEPKLFANLNEGVSVSFAGLTRKEEGDSVEHVADENGVITPHPENITALTVDAGAVAEGRTSIVTGVVRSISPIRTFTTRRGTESRVRNIKLDSEIGDGCVSVACWNGAADVAILAGDRVEVINAPVRLNKYGDVELSVGRGAVLRERNQGGTYTEMVGIAVPRKEGMTIEDGVLSLLLIADTLPAPAFHIRVAGIRKNARLYAEHIEMLPESAAGIRERLSRL
ncbi:MAG: hypothetical protein LBU24_02435 [Methanocalculaceae archaeon]|jgi:replication factor A1|nr:hypothetical protein [Methanocalculaceae archaeon]